MIQPRNYFRLSILSAILLLTCFSLSASGGVFNFDEFEDVTTWQTSQEVIFIVNDNGTITAIMSIEFEGSWGSKWIIPVPTMPQVDITSVEYQSVAYLRLVTEVTPIIPENICQNAIPHPNFAPEYGFRVGFATKNNLQFDVLTSGEMQAWIDEGSRYFIDHSIPKLEHYIQNEMFFVVIDTGWFEKAFDTKRTQPIMLTYEAEHPTLPIILSSVASAEEIPIVTWIFADQPYIPSNYAHPTMDVSRLHADGAYSLPYANWFHDSHNTYSVLRRDTLDPYHGHAFVTDLSMTTQDFQSGATADKAFHQEWIVNDSLLSALFEHRYVTRLYGELSPDEMTLDPIFVPDTNQTMVDNYPDLNLLMDGETYWGCTDSHIPAEFIP